jgi:hypothetical protein
MAQTVERSQHAAPFFVGTACSFKVAGDGADGKRIARVQIEDLAHYLGFGIDHLVIRRMVVTPAYITVTIRGTAQHADLAGLCPMPLAAPRPFQNLSAFVLGNHALELQQQLIFRPV